MTTKIVIFLLIVCFSSGLFGRETVTGEETRTFKTYPFGDPDTVPRMGRIYPYFRFDGYSHTGKNQEWKIIRMENPYIELHITPEIGGKIWGAVEKSTGNAFIYYNKVVKFRDIAMRGAWTSGGIEFNFGAIGHAPPCATPVDYLYRKNKDGSTSCFLGGIDLPSRTQWRVEVHLPADKAYFRTICSWYNPTGLHQSYYHWMNAAADARDDLQFCYPGACYIGHDGSRHSWPFLARDDKEKNLSNYKENNFGSHKSYHVLGTYTEHFGGYYKKTRFGFGNWSLYDDKPGKKLWLWALSRQGGIWEDLLTDKGNNQYIEFQSGRLLNQADEKSSQTAYKHAFFQPHAFDRWNEVWFPFKSTGGMTHASPHGVLNVEEVRDKGLLEISVCALQKLDGPVRVIAGNGNDNEKKVIYNKNISLEPMHLFKDAVETGSLGNYRELRVEVGEGKLSWELNQNKNLHLKKYGMKPFNPAPGSAGSFYTSGVEAMRQRNFGDALEQFNRCLEKEPAHIPALVRTAGIHFRQARYAAARQTAKRALQIDAYHAGANFIYGLAQVPGGRSVDAKEAFGWAARSMAYRSAAYTELAIIYLREKNYRRAQLYAGRALDYNRFNIRALQVSALAYRLLNNAPEAARVLQTILNIDPLNHFARFEASLPSLVRNELPHESFLELAVQYAAYRLDEDALRILQSAPPHPIVHYWRAYLAHRLGKETVNAHLEKAAAASPRLVFPFRNETIPVLQWALEKTPHWKTRYYLGLIHWKNRDMEAAQEQFAKCGNTPGYPVFYLARANFLSAGEKQSAAPDAILADYRKAVALAPDDWRASRALANYYEQKLRFGPALDTAGKIYKKVPGNYMIALDYARHLLNNKKYKKCLSILKKTRVLPYEGAREGRVIYRKANLMLAVRAINRKKFAGAAKYIEAARLWPENLGVGKPYDPDETPENFLAAICSGKKNGTPGLERQILEMLD